MNIRKEYPKLPKNLIIGFTGYAGSGKDTAGKILCEHYGFKRLSFADKLKEEVATAFSIDLNYFHDVKLKDTPLLDMPIVINNFTLEALGEDILINHKYYTPRLLCIYYAACLKGQDNDVWIKKVNRQLSGDYGRVIITDVRYLNEADWIKKRFGYVLRISKGHEDGVLMHESETQLSSHKFDGVIENTGTLELLDYKLSVMLGLIESHY